MCLEISISHELTENFRLLKHKIDNTALLILEDR
jgi:hypothetical protein